MSLNDHPPLIAEASEKAVLSVILRLPKEYMPKAQAEGITEGHFYVPARSLIFRRLLSMPLDAIEVSTLAQKLHEHGELEDAGGTQNLGELITYEPTTHKFDYHLQELKTYHAKRAAERLGKELFNSAASASPEQIAQLGEKVSGLFSSHDIGPFKWGLVHGFETWTDDSETIGSLSDPAIIEGLLREREVGAVIGAAKTSKTWFTLALALAVARGDDFLGFKTNQRKVLYLDYELKENTFRKRMSLVSPEAPYGFFYRTLRGVPRLPSVNDIASLVDGEGFGLVVVDSLYRTGWITEENNNDSTARDLRPLQDFTERCKASMICVDHTAKGGGAERAAVDAARGASAKGGFWDCLMVLRPTDKGPDPAGNYAILDPVLRDWPRLQNLPLVSFSWTPTTCTVDAAGEVSPGESDATATKILGVVAEAEKGISVGEIVVKTGIPETTVRKTLKVLVRNRKVLEFASPTHKQQKLYRFPDLADEPRQTPPNPAA